MEEKDLLKRLVGNDALFNNIHVFQQRFEIIPDKKNHIGAFIEFQDMQDRREEFLSELVDTIVDWVYSSEKYNDLVESFKMRGKSIAAANHAAFRKARDKFRKSEKPDRLSLQGQFGELLLFHFIQRFMHAVPLLRKMPITTSPKHERFGADAIHYKLEDDRNIIILGEAKTYTSSYSFNQAFETALNSIIESYHNLNKELSLYIHEDFLDNELNKIAEMYLSNRLPNVEVHLVSIVTYNENRNIKYTTQKDIQLQIQKIIEDRYKNFDNDKIDINRNPILNRITYIVFPVWELEDMIDKFQRCL